MREVLDKASDAIEGKFQEEPLIEGSIRTTVGNTYLSLGHYKQAEPHLKRALVLRRTEVGDDHPDTLISINNMGSLLDSMGKLAEAEPYYREVLEARRRVLGDDHPSTLISTHNMGRLFRDLGRLNEAEALGAEAVRKARRSLPEGHWYTGVFLTGYGKTLAQRERYTDAEAALLEAHEILEAALGAEHKRTIKVIRSLVALYDAWDAAEPGKGYADQAGKWRVKLEEDGTKGQRGGGTKEEESPS
jgi:tetratricopeptide (TPR) repeat protein